MRVIQRVALLLPAVLISVVSFAQYKLTDPLPVDPSLRIGKLSNGLVYYIRKNKKPENKVELRLVVNAGSVLENENQRGLAHFMEHMNFNGSKHFPKNQLVDFLQKSGVKFGADLNAYTGFDETVYILPVPSDDAQVLEKSFTILEDWAFNNLFDEKEIEKERGVVLEESRLHKGAADRMSTAYFPVLFNGSKYAERLPIGKENILKTFKPETLKQFYKTWYRPDLMAVVVVGDIDPDQAEKKIREHFGNYKNPATPQPRPSIISIKDRTKPQAMVLTDEEETNTIVQVYNFVRPQKPVKTWGDYRSEIVDELVSNMIANRLADLAQGENPPFLFANTGYGPFIRGYSSFNSFAVLGKGNLKEAIDALIGETNRATQYGFLNSELARAKSDLLNNLDKAKNEKDKTESSQLVGGYVNSFLTGAPTPGVDNRFKFLQSTLPGISLSEINESAKKMPSVENAFALVQAPAAMKKELPDSVQLLKDMRAAALRPVKAFEETAVASSLLDKEPSPGKIINESKNEKLGTYDYTLSNGVTISIKPTTLKNDEILMDAWRWGGAHKFPVEDKQVAPMAPILVNQLGLGNMSAVELRKYLSGKTIDIHPYMNLDEEGVEGSSSVKDFENFLQLCYLIFTQPRRDEKMLNTMVSSQKAALMFMTKDPQISFQDTLQKILYDNHPWVAGFPKSSDFDAMTMDRLMNIYQKVYGNAYGMHFTFVGNIDPEKAKPLLEKYLGSLPAQKMDISYKDVGMRLTQGKTEIALKRGKEPKATINLNFEGETSYTRDNRLNLGALMEVLNIKITEKLREDMSGAYTGRINGSIFKRPYEHYSINASIPCGPENVAKLSAALLDILKQAREKGIDQKDLDKVKENWRKSYRTGLQSNDYWLTALSNSFINGENAENLLDYEKRIDAITVQDLQEAAKKYLTLDNMVYAVMYPENFDVKEGVTKTKKGF